MVDEDYPLTPRETLNPDIRHLIGASSRPHDTARSELLFKPDKPEPSHESGEHGRWSPILVTASDCDQARLGLGEHVSQPVEDLDGVPDEALLAKIELTSTLTESPQLDSAID